MKKIELPLTDEVIHTLHAGESVLLSGSILTGRDCAHKRICEMLDAGTPLPFDYAEQTIYYAGPCPAPEGKACGSCGPTTSARMDAYTPALTDAGVTVAIGKGKRSAQVVDAMRRNSAVYFAAVGGAAAIIKNAVKECNCVAYPDLGCEAVYRLYVCDLDVIVAIDCKGNTILR